MDCQYLIPDTLSDINYIYGTKQTPNGEFSSIHKSDVVASQTQQKETDQEVEAYIAEDQSKDHQKEVVEDMVLPTTTQSQLGAGKKGTKKSGSIFKVKKAFRSKYF